MLNNYIKIAFRNIRNKPFFSAINIVGLALGMAACISIFYYVGYEFSYEKSFEESENIHQVYFKRTQAEGSNAYLYLPSGFQPEISSLKTIESSFRLIGIDYQNNSLIYEEGSEKKVFEQSNIYFSDPQIDDVLSLEMLNGSFDKMNEPFKMILTEHVANKFFVNAQNAIGKTMTVSGNVGPRDYEVVGVIPDLPGNTHFGFEVILSIVSLEQIEGPDALSKWEGWNSRTYIKSEEKPKRIENSIEKKLQNRSFFNEEGNSWEVLTRGIEEMHLTTINEDATISNTKERLLWGLVGIGVFILVLAWTNFVNLSTSRAVERAREVGVRKVLGSHKIQLRAQFMLESFFINIVAFLLAFTIVQIALPFLSEITNPMVLLPEQQKVFWLAIVGLLVLGSLLSGIYPAFIMSRFKPAVVLKGKMASSKSGVAIRKVLVVFQFVVSTVMIIGTFIIYQQIHYMKNKELGMTIDNMLIIDAPPGSLVGDNESFFSKVNAFKGEVSKLAGISSIASSSYVPGSEIGWNGMMKQESQPEDQLKSLKLIACDRNFADTYDLKLVAGRFYNESDETFGKGDFVINKAAVDFLGFRSPEEAIGQKLNGSSMAQELTIVGVVDNFHQQSLKEAIAPCAFVKSIWNNYFTVAMNINENATGEEKIKVLRNKLEDIEAEWSTYFPDAPFDYTFLDQRFDAQYKEDQQFSAIITIFAAISIIIAVLGLLGLATYSVSQRTKEIGIRKVLGASIKRIFVLISYDYIKLIVIATVLAIPAVYYLMSDWLTNYTYRIDITYWMLIVPVLVILFIAIAVIGYQILMATRKNPVDSLRYE